MEISFADLYDGRANWSVLIGSLLDEFDLFDVRARFRASDLPIAAGRRAIAAQGE
jgi:hypothetical protein